MSKNTYWTITERADGLFNIAKFWADDSNSELSDRPALYRRDSLTLKEATAIADADPAEYGYRITWHGGPVCRCGEAQADHTLYIVDKEYGDSGRNYDILMGPLCPGQLDGIDVYEARGDHPEPDKGGCLTSDCGRAGGHAGRHIKGGVSWI